MLVARASVSIRDSTTDEATSTQCGCLCTAHQHGLSFLFISRPVAQTLTDTLTDWQLVLSMEGGRRKKRLGKDEN